MIHICAMSGTLPLARMLMMIFVTGHPDALQLRQAGLEQGVPAKVMWSVAYEETRHSNGSGAISNAGAYGRMQVMPSIWGQDRHCQKWWIYSRNIRCGAYILRTFYTLYGDWQSAEYHYVGGDSVYIRHTGANELAYELALGPDAY